MWMLVIGWFFTLLAGGGLIGTAVAQFMGYMPDAVPETGWQESAMFALAVVKLGCAVLYLFPPTATLGAVLLTAYMGGAVATHLRIGDAFFFQMLPPILAWFGLFMRDARIRATLPWRTDPESAPYGGFLVFLARMAFILLVLIGVIAGLIEATSADYRIGRVATMNAPPEKVFAQVNDFHKWKDWSPWEKLDPEMKRTYEGAELGTGAVYKWSGNDKVGEGMMTITESKPNERIRIKLKFIKPIEMEADSEFTFTSDGDKTVVRWTMMGHSDNYEAKAKIVGMQFIVGNLYAEGLTNLKAIVEKK
jgi:uncharacterized protein YndB with AHSA1/START domain